MPSAFPIRQVPLPPHIRERPDAETRAALAQLVRGGTFHVVAAPIGAAMDGRTLAAASLIGHLITVVFTAVALPESLPVAQRTPFRKAALSTSPRKTLAPLPIVYLLPLVQEWEIAI